jgi:GDP-D-mannose dehydratase
MPSQKAGLLTLAFLARSLLQRGIVASGEHAGKVVVKVSERFFRPAEVELLLGDPQKARDVLGWDPDKMTQVDKLCEEMVDADVELAKMELAKIDLKKKLKVGSGYAAVLSAGVV